MASDRRLEGGSVNWTRMQLVTPRAAGHYRDSSYAVAEVSGLPRLRHNAMCQLPTLWHSCFMVFSFFPGLTFGNKSALWLLACSHYRANGEGHVRSKDPLRDREAGWGGGSSLSSQGSQRTDRMVYPAPPGQLRHGTRGVVNTFSHTTMYGYFLITTSIEKSRKFVGLNEHQCKQQAHIGLRNQVQVA